MKLTLRRYLVYWAILVITGFILVVVINYYYDPAHLFSGGRYEKGIANILLSGKNVEGALDYDQRNMQRYYISNLREGKEVIVLGSSRSTQITSNLFPGKSFFNNSMSSASIEDYLAIYELYLQHNYAPEIVVLGLDPWMLNRNSGQYLWSSLDDEYFAMIQRLGVPPSDISVPSDINKFKFNELVSLSYFNKSVNQLLSGRTGERYYATGDRYLVDGGRLADGSRVYNLQYRSRSVDEVEASAISFATAQPVAGLGEFTNLDEAYLVQLVTFVKYLQDHNTTVLFYLPPYHPTAYGILSKSESYKIILQVEAKYRTIAQDLGITVIGGYNPEASSLTNEDFYDGQHPKQSAVNRAFESAGFGP
jgi:hypothetical protein